MVLQSLDEYKALTLFSLQHFVEELSNHTGYPVSKLVGKKIWRVYDTLTCQVRLIFLSKHADAPINTMKPVYYLRSACMLTAFCSWQRLQLLIQTAAAEQWGKWKGICFSLTSAKPGERSGAGNHFYTYSKTWIGQHIEMIIKALWDGWILGQVEYAHSHLQNEHLLSSDQR